MADLVPAGDVQPTTTPPAAATVPAVTPGPNGPALAPAANGDVIKQLTETTQTLTTAQAKIAELEKTLDTLQSANQTVNADFTTLKSQAEETAKALKAREAEVTNYQTQLEQTLAQVNEAKTKVTELTKTTDLFNLIADTPEFHGMVGSFKNLSKVIKSDAAADDVKALLTAMAAENKQQVAGALEIFRAGGSPPAQGGSSTPGAKSMEEAWQNWQNAYKSGNQEAIRHAMSLVNSFSKIEENTQA
jgi:hypothetical protein